MIIKFRYIFFFISAALMVASIFAVFTYGLKPGIDFTGGTLWQVKLTNNQQLTTNDFAAFFENELGVKNATVYPEAESQSYLIRISHISEEQHQQYLALMENKFGEINELRYETIGPTIGKELKNKAIWAIILILFGISLYVAYAFRKVSYPVKSWKYGVITLLTLFHDVVISVGALALLNWKFGVELDTKFIVALLVIIGFSVHDTIVVFDRIRENLLLDRGQKELKEIINDSVRQTFARSVNTSLTLIITLLALFFYGPLILKYFVLLILAGTIVGTYSSIFIASPALLFFKNK
ncbi:MAG: protein translocase subunit SecF [Patescibacteria group bacterium]|nr:protein translocase subunit SecF [Patescibacteria group bacterium]